MLIFLSGLAAAALAAWLACRLPLKKQNLLLNLLAVLFPLSEIWKQLLLTWVNGGVYRWWYFPFQLIDIRIDLPAAPATAAPPAPAAASRLAPAAVSRLAPAAASRSAPAARPPSLLAELCAHGLSGGFRPAGRAFRLRGPDRHALLPFPL